MSVIGTFTPNKEGGWTGIIHTLIMNVKVRLVPNDNRENENAPAFRVFVGKSRIGDAWKSRSTGANPAIIYASNSMIRAFQRRFLPLSSGQGRATRRGSSGIGSEERGELAFRANLANSGKTAEIGAFLSYSTLTLYDLGVNYLLYRRIK